MGKFILTLMFFCCTCAIAANLPDTDARTIKDAGIPIHHSAAFAYGNKDVGFRFASNESPEKVRKWYQEQLPGWSLFDQYGTWILYNGGPGAGVSEIMTSNQVAVQENANLPEWHSLQKDMTTEIVIMVFK